MKETNNFNGYRLAAIIFIGLTVLGAVFIINYFLLQKELLTTQTALQKEPVSFELEGSCDTGFIGVDYRSIFVNEPYRDLADSYFTRNRNVTKYDTQYLPQTFNLKNINGLKCSYKLKGTIPLIVLNKFLNLTQ